MAMPPARTIVLLAPGGMGTKIAVEVAKCGGSTILTNLDRRLAATVQRMQEAGMWHVSYTEIFTAAMVVFSVVPPMDVFAVAEAVVVNPELFDGTAIKFIDGAIVGAPPSDTYNPGIYVSADEFGLNVILLKGEGSGVGDASTLKMVHVVHPFSAASLVAVQATSPSTAKGLHHALSISQPVFIDLSTQMILQMIPKVYRFIKEMDEITGFVGGKEGRTFEGPEEVFVRVAKAHEGSQVDGGSGSDLNVLLKFVEQSRKACKCNL
ncbi:hypothetical protein B0H10DRAFT_1960465 [Mycena sp. CBHHK59/15]|nr:hypothetical protein B0H10DRAFT_1960465 [Mycena sp. CBHHK59/15]